LTRGDLVSVPAGLSHRFSLCPSGRACLRRLACAPSPGAQQWLSVQRFASPDDPREVQTSYSGAQYAIARTGVR